MEQDNAKMARVCRRENLLQRRQNVTQGGNNGNIQNNAASRRRTFSRISTSTADIHIQSQEPESSTANDVPRRRRKIQNVSTSSALSNTQSQDPESSTAARRRGRPRIHAAPIIRQGINVTNTNIDYWDIGDADRQCQFCRAGFWYAECSRSEQRPANPRYPTCCGNGKISLPQMKTPPPQLLELTSGNGARSKHFLQNMRAYNSMFAFTSMGGKIDRSVNTGNGPPVFKLYGQNYHLIGGLVPTEGEQPKFAQLYIYDTSNEVANRINSVRSSENATNLQEDVVDELKAMLDQNNILVQWFRMAKEKISEVGNNNVSLKLIGRRSSQPTTYNLPDASEVAALIVGDFDEQHESRDIIVETRAGKLQRINELHL
ncbi:hypothetical protein CASFOL_010202 [Castilleja foliolosa]|uniref:Helitron helicase-like domain-containing protein n=1 Tax=Castilleja foliolosa TaxID=1961234 RepID=A0ABD3DTS6_9LAMI